MIEELGIRAFAKSLADARGRFLRPPPKLNNVEWCAKNYYFSDRNRPGFYDTKFAPYQNEILETFGNPSFNEMVLMMGSQTGKTSTQLQLLSLMIANDPDTTMWAGHEEEFLKRFVKTRFHKMLEDVKPLRPLIKKESRGAHGDSWNLKSFPGGNIQFVTPGGSGGQITGFPIRYVFADEVSKFPTPANGDPIALLRQRQVTYEYTKIHKLVLASTPLDEGTCRITKLYENSDQRIYQHQCVHCDEYFTPGFDLVFWENDDPETARLVCPHCGGLHNDIERLKGMRRGRWHKQNPGHKVAGFRVSAFSSPFVGLSYIVEKHLTSLLDPALRKQFVNEILCETYQDVGVSFDELKLHERAEPYTTTSIPNNVIYLTAGVDVQKDRLEAVMIGWASQNESYSMGRFVVNGSPDATATWDEMHLVLQQPYIRQDGVKLKLLVAGFDTGFNGKAVFKFCNKYARFGYIPVKGKGGETSNTAPIWGSRRKGRGQANAVFSVGTHKAKELLLSWLNKGKFDPEKPSNPGYCHFSSNCDEEYFNQLGSENKQTVIKRGRKSEMWVRQGNRAAEVLDCTVYAIATTHYLTENRIKNELSRINKELKAQILKQSEQTKEEPPTNEPPAKVSVVKIEKPQTEIVNEEDQRLSERIKQTEEAEKQALREKYAKMYGNRSKPRFFH